MEEKPWDLKDMEALWDATSAEALGDCGFVGGGSYWRLLSLPLMRHSFLLRASPPPNTRALAGKIHVLSNILWMLLSLDCPALGRNGKFLKRAGGMWKSRA